MILKILDPFPSPSNPLSTTLFPSALIVNFEFNPSVPDQTAKPAITMIRFRATVSEQKLTCYVYVCVCCVFLYKKTTLQQSLPMECHYEGY